LESQIIRHFVSKHPNIKLVDSETSYHQLREEGITFVLTCYGSAGHELPLLGFTVINASYNSHVAYSFNIHAKTLNEYREILMDLPNRALASIDFKDIYEYYFIQKTLIDQEYLMGFSQKELSKVSQGNIFGSRAMAYLEQNFNNIRSSAIRVLRETVSSRLVYSFEQAISEEVQLKVQVNQANQEFYEKLGFQNC
jgi:hypothetical protein